MAEFAVYLQPAFILQHRPYRESSVLLEVFTRDFGIVTVLARGVRKEKSKTAGLLQPFSLLLLSYLDKNELKILTAAEMVSFFSLQRLSLYCGFYVNELVQRFLHKHDPHTDLFIRYQACLQTLMASDAIEQSLRYFELDLLEEVGYGIQLDLVAGRDTVQCDHYYDFQAELGIVEDQGGSISGQALLALSHREALLGATLSEAKLLTRKMLDVHLQGRPLKSRAVVANVIRYL